MPVCRIRDRNVWEWIWDPFVVWIVGLLEELRGKAVRCGWVSTTLFLTCEATTRRRLATGSILLKDAGLCDQATDVMPTELRRHVTMEHLGTASGDEHEVSGTSPVVEPKTFAN